MKNALVTGGTKGIGLAIVAMLLREGYYVVATYARDLTAARQCRETLLQQGFAPNHLDTRLQIVKADQASSDEMSDLAAFLKTLHHIDCLVLNAGTTLRKSLDETTDAEWEHIMRVNLNSNVFLIRDLLGVIPNGSRIVFIGSQMGIHPHAASLAYGVSKAAVHALAQNLVKVFEKTATTVNAVAPGFVETEWQRDKPQEIRERILQKTAVARFAYTDEIADAVRFCLHNAFLNGSVLEINGGYCHK